jgi:Ca-activated chloride channel family protein
VTRSSDNHSAGPDREPPAGALPAREPIEGLVEDDGHLRYLLTAYLLGDISSAGRLEVERHLAVCAACREERVELEGTLSLVGDVLRDESQHESLYAFEERRLARILEAGRRSSTLSWPAFSWWPRAALAAAAVLLCAVGFGIYVQPMSAPNWDQERAVATRAPSGYRWAGAKGKKGNVAIGGGGSGAVSKSRTSYKPSQSGKGFFTPPADGPPASDSPALGSKYAYTGRDGEGKDDEFRDALVVGGDTSLAYDKRSNLKKDMSTPDEPVVTFGATAEASGEWANTPASTPKPKATSALAQSRGGHVEIGAGIVTGNAIQPDTTTETGIELTLEIPAQPRSQSQIVPGAQDLGGAIPIGDESVEATGWDGNGTKVVDAIGPSGSSSANTPPPPPMSGPPARVEAPFAEPEPELVAEGRFDDYDGANRGERRRKLEESYAREAAIAEAGRLAAETQAADRQANLTEQISRERASGRKVTKQQQKELARLVRDRDRRGDEAEAIAALAAAEKAVAEEMAKQVEVVEELSRMAHEQERLVEHRSRRVAEKKKHAKKAAVEGIQDYELISGGTGLGLVEVETDPAEGESFRDAREQRVLKEAQVWEISEPDLVELKKNQSDFKAPRLTLRRPDGDADVVLDIGDDEDEFEAGQLTDRGRFTRGQKGQGRITVMNGQRSSLTRNEANKSLDSFPALIRDVEVNQTGAIGDVPVIGTLFESDAKAPQGVVVGGLARGLEQEELEKEDGKRREVVLGRGDAERALRSYGFYQELDRGLSFQGFLERQPEIPTPPIGDEGLGREEFRKRYKVNPFVDASRDRLSTFAMDVDTGSYTRTRALLRAGQLPAPEDVRTEEFVNSFRYERAADVDRVFSVFCEGAASPFGAGTELLAVTVKARELTANERKPAVLTLAIDTSGSMALEARIDQVRQALGVLVGALRPDDRIAVVAYGRQPVLLLPHTPVRERDRILGALASLTPGGSTNLEAGLELAYRIADDALAPGAMNRVILCSDGVATEGARGAEDVLEKVKVFAKRGIDLSVVGFGRARYNDGFLERLADEGNGSYAFVDSAREAARLFVDDLPATLQVLARDAKIQVDFDPSTVARYRLLGYENRDIKDSDFRNDSVDAGEVGPGSTVTALYEVARHEGTHGALGRVYLRYHSETGNRVEELDFPIPPGAVRAGLAEASSRLGLVACAAELAELLRQSYWAQDGSFDAVLETLRGATPETRATSEWQELYELTERAQDLWIRRLAERTR